MALQTKSISANGSNGHHKFTLTVTENSTDTTNNTSSLSWSFVISPVVKDFDWESNSGKVKYSVTIDGNTYSGIIATYDGVSTVTIKSGTMSCAHNADGAKTISCSFSITDSTGWSFAPGNASANGTMALTAIARKYTVTYYGNGGISDIEEPLVDTATYGEDYYLRANWYTRPGYTFTGWNEMPDGSATTDWGSEWIGQPWNWTYTRNVTLYAQWKPNENAYIPYVDNGEGWERVEPYFDNGSAWGICVSAIGGNEDV